MKKVNWFIYFLYSLFIFCSTPLILGQTESNNEFILNSDLNSYSGINFVFGIRDELLIMKANTDNNPKTVYLLPFNIHIVQGIKFLKYYEFNLKLGLLVASYQISNDFHPGFDWGFFFKANFFTPNIYGITGIDFMYSTNSNDGSHGASLTNYISENNGITFYCIGLGYKTSKNFCIDIMYYIPNKKNFGADKITFYSEVQQSYEKLIYGVINIGFQYSFIF